MLYDFNKLLSLFILFCISKFIFGYECTQRLYEAKGIPSGGSNGFTIEIFPVGSSSTNSQASLSHLTNNQSTTEHQSTGYVPGKNYRVVLRGWRTQFFVQTFRGFGLIATLETNGKPGGKFDVKKVSFFNLFLKRMGFKSLRDSIFNKIEFY